jgi:hypothetical protein
MKNIQQQFRNHKLSTREYFFNYGFCLFAKFQNIIKNIRGPGAGALDTLNKSIDTAEKTFKYKKMNGIKFK